MSKNIIITGTSRGIGLETLRILSGQGHKLLALSRRTTGVERLNLAGVQTLPCDIHRKEDLEDAAQWVSGHWDRVDVLIHNAGAIVNQAFENISAEDFERVYRTNVFGVAALTRSILPFMDQGSHVVTISSMGGVQGSVKFPGLSAYSSSKAAVIGLMEVLAEEYKERGPAFNVLALGAVQTEMLEEAFPGYKASLKPEEMAAYIAQFAVEGQKFYNGKVLQVSNSTP